MAIVLDAAEYIQEQIEQDNIPYLKLEGAVKKQSKNSEVHC